MKGSVYKRIGILQGSRIEDKEEREKEVRKELEAAAAAYQQAIDEWAADGNNFHWTATQWLALAAILGGARDQVVFQMAARLAERDLSQPGRRERAWAHGTLAELALIRPWHEDGMNGDFQAVEDKVVSHCREIVKLAGATFPVESTRRQFQRYVEKWYLAEEEDDAFLGPKIVSIAKAAVKELQAR